MHPIHDRVLAFIADPLRGGFESLALEVFRHQFESIEPYRRHCESRAMTPETVADWRRIPPVPVEAFKQVELCCAPPQRRFLSSGTTQGAERRSVHAMPDLRLYRASAVAGMKRFLFPDEKSMRLLALIHPVADLPDSSLAQMVAWAMDEYAASGSEYAAGTDDIDVGRAAEIVRGSERDGAPLCVMATTAALIRFIDACAERGWAFRLPHSSRVMDTGGAKGGARSMSRKGLLHAVWQTLAVPGYFCTNEYGMSELSSQAWENVIADRVAGRFGHRALVTPPWMHTRVLDPVTLDDTPPGQPGLLCHYDLANAGTAMAGPHRRHRSHHTRRLRAPRPRHRRRAPRLLAGVGGVRCRERGHLGRNYCGRDARDPGGRTFR